jgi:hypothetical protein
MMTTDDEYERAVEIASALLRMFRHVPDPSEVGTATAQAWDDLADRLDETWRAAVRLRDRIAKLPDERSAA